MLPSKVASREATTRVRSCSPRAGIGSGDRAVTATPRAPASGQQGVGGCLRRRRLPRRRWAASAYPTDLQRVSTVLVAVVDKDPFDIGFSIELDEGYAAGPPAVIPVHVNPRDTVPTKACPEVMVRRGSWEVGDANDADGRGQTHPPRPQPSVRKPFV